MTLTHAIYLTCNLSHGEKVTILQIIEETSTGLQDDSWFLIRWWATKEKYKAWKWLNPTLFGDQPSTLTAWQIDAVFSLFGYDYGLFILIDMVIIYVFG